MSSTLVLSWELQNLNQNFFCPFIFISCLLFWQISAGIAPMAPLGGLGRTPQKSCVKTFEKTPNMQTVNPGMVSGLSSLSIIVVGASHLTIWSSLLLMSSKPVSYFLGTIPVSLDVEISQIASNQISHCLQWHHHHYLTGWDCHDNHDDDHHHHRHRD